MITHKQIRRFRNFYEGRRHEWELYEKAVLVTSANANHAFLSVNCYLCLDIDECAVKTDNCSLNAACKNTEGSFNCSCNPGFFGSGISCDGNNE